MSVAQTLRKVQQYQRLQKIAQAKPRASTNALDPTAYADDPVGFAERILGIRSVWSRQRELLESVLEHDRVAVRAGRKVSKSNSVAILALWWLLARGGRVFLTSSSFPQIKSILWHELAAQVARARLPLIVPLDPATGIQHDGADIVGRSTNRRENMQGYSGADVLYIIDEASGVPTEIMEAIEGNCAGGGTILILGNPTLTSGTFFEAFHNNRGFWHPIQISSRESPNVTGEMQVPGLATPEWIARTERQYGSESPFVAVHVDGNFPAEAQNAVIGLALLEAAKKRHDDTPAEGRLELGVDVAWTGDDQSVIYPRRGRKALEPVAVRGMDPVDVSALVLEVARELRNEEDEDLPRVKVDVIGIGAGVYAILERSDEVEVLAVNVAERATSEPNEGGYAKLRDQVWFATRDWLQDGGSIPEHAETEAELLAATYRFDAQGRYKVASKDELKEILSRSPDYADALGLSIYEPPPVQIFL